MVTNDNDNFEDEDEDLEDPDAKTPEELALEAEFEKVVKQAHAEIDAELKKASEHLTKAVKLSEMYGVPFSARVSPLSNTYTPQTFQKKFGRVDADFVDEVTDTWDDEGRSYGGWRHSAVCN